MRSPHSREDEEEGLHRATCTQLYSSTGSGSPVTSSLKQYTTELYEGYLGAAFEGGKVAVEGYPYDFTVQYTYNRFLLYY